MRQRTTLHAVRLLPFAAMLLALTACSEPPPEVEAKPRVVRTTVVQKKADAVPTTMAGVSKAATESNLSFRVGGTLASVPAKVGQVVRRGQTLARLDPVEARIGRGGLLRPVRQGRPRRPQSQGEGQERGPGSPGLRASDRTPAHSSRRR